MKHSFTAEATDEGRTLHVFLRSKGVSSALIKKIKFEDDGITVNGLRRNTDARIREGDTVVINDSDLNVPSTVIPEEGELDILFRDEGYMVINKPAGMPCHPSFNHPTGTVANFFMGMEENRVEKRICRVINRLDRNTTGLVLIAMDSFYADAARDRVEKEYIALIEGMMDPESGTIDLPIARQAESIITRCVREDGERAVTRYETTGTDGRISAVRIRLETGRTHQIRVHFSHLGHPLLGDELYGGDMSKMERHALHCRKLEFCGADGKIVAVTCPVPEDMVKSAPGIDWKRVPSD